MNISYSRKTDKSAEEVAESIKKELKARNIAVVGEAKLASGSGVVMHIYDAKKTEKILAEDPSLIGLIPAMVFIGRADGKTTIGLGNPQLLGGTQKIDQLGETIDEMGRELKESVNGAAGLGEPKLERIKLYSTATCPYCKMEKDYLEKHNISFELVMVDADRKAAQEMVQKTGQMGVPATEIQFDDGDSEIIIGFDKGRLNELLKIK